MFALSILELFKLVPNLYIFLFALVTLGPFFEDDIPGLDVFRLGEFLPDPVVIIIFLAARF